MNEKKLMELIHNLYVKKKGKTLEQFLQIKITEDLVVGDIKGLEKIYFCTYSTEKDFSTIYSQLNPKKGYFEIGEVKRRDNQRKLHYTQMFEKEKHYLASELNKIQRLYFTEHLYHNVQKGKTILDRDLIKKSMLSKELHKYIIEYNETYDYIKTRYTQRIVFKCVEPFEVKIEDKQVMCNLFVVYDMTKKQVITTYLNDIKDTHKNLNVYRYKLKRIKPIKKGGLLL